MSENRIDSSNPSNGYFAVVEDKLFRRLDSKNHFCIQHYYDSLIVCFLKLVLIQVIAFRFRCRALEKSDKKRINQWAKDLLANLRKQKRKVLSLIAGLILKLKPSFEEPAVSGGH